MRCAGDSLSNSDLPRSRNSFIKEDIKEILTSGLVPNGQMGAWGHFPHFPLVKHRGKVSISWLLL